MLERSGQRDGDDGRDHEDDGEDARAAHQCAAAKSRSVARNFAGSSQKSQCIESSKRSTRRFLPSKPMAESSSACGFFFGKASGVAISSAGACSFFVGCVAII